MMITIAYTSSTAFDSANVEAYAISFSGNRRGCTQLEPMRPMYDRDRHVPRALSACINARFDSLRNPVRCEGLVCFCKSLFTAVGSTCRFLLDLVLNGTVTGNGIISHRLQSKQTFVK